MDPSSGVGDVRERPVLAVVQDVVAAAGVGDLGQVAAGVAVERHAVVVAVFGPHHRPASPRELRRVEAHLQARLVVNEVVGAVRVAGELRLELRSAEHAR